VALIPDPLDELPEVVSRVEDVLRVTEAKTEEDEVRLDTAARAAGELAEALRAAREEAPTLVAADGHELGALLCCPSASRWLPFVLAGVDAISRAELDTRVRGASAALSLIERSIPHDGTPEGIERDRVVTERVRMHPGKHVVVEPTAFEAAVHEAQAVLLAAWPSEAGARVVLDAAREAAYRRLVALVVGDIERAFAAG